MTSTTANLPSNDAFLDLLEPGWSIDGAEIYSNDYMTVWVDINDVDQDTADGLMIREASFKRVCVCVSEDAFEYGEGMLSAAAPDWISEAIGLDSTQISGWADDGSALFELERRVHVSREQTWTSAS